MEEASQGMSYDGGLEPEVPFALPASGSEETELVFGPIPGYNRSPCVGPYNRSPQMDPSPVTPPLVFEATMEVQRTAPQIDPAPWIDPAPQQPKTPQDMGGQWMYNTGWTREAHPCLIGWLFVQGWFDWGACLSWHVQRSHVINPGSLHWQCWVWYKEKTYGSWKAYLLLTEDIPDDDHHHYSWWQIHEEGDA